MQRIPVLKGSASNSTTCLKKVRGVFGSKIILDLEIPNIREIVPDTEYPIFRLADNSLILI